MSLDFDLNDDTNELVDIIENTEYFYIQINRLSRRCDDPCNYNDLSDFADEIKKYISEIQYDINLMDGVNIDFNNIEYLEMAKFFV